MAFYLGNAHTFSSALLSCQVNYPIKAYINRWRTCFVIWACQFPKVRIQVQTNNVD